MRTPHTVFQNRRPAIARALIVSLIGVALDSIGLGPGGASAGSSSNESSSVLQTTVPMLTDDFAADGIVNRMAAALSAILTNPTGSGWFDRYGLENSTKCQSEFGTTYAAANGSRANIRLGLRDFLIQENWVNARKGYCSMAAPQQ